MNNKAREGKALPWIIVAVSSLYFLLPLVATFLFSLKGKKGSLSFVAYQHVLVDARFVNSFLFSLSMAIVTIACGLALIVPTAVWVHVKLPKARRLMDGLTMLPFVIPPIVLVFGLIKLYSRPPIALTSSPALLVAGYIVLVFPYLYRAIDTGLGSMDVRRLYEASRVLGASLVRTLFSVILPGLRSAILNSVFISFAIVMGELTMAILLSWQAFAPYIAMIGRDKAYEPAALTIMSFALTWISIMLINLIARGARYGQAARAESGLAVIATASEGPKAATPD
jgi:putative spermidine/putrescine transport system permease protein